MTAAEFKINQAISFVKVTHKDPTEWTPRNVARLLQGDNIVLGIYLAPFANDAALDVPFS